MGFKSGKLVLSGRIIGALKSLSNNAKCSVGTNYGFIEAFNVKRGLGEKSLFSFTTLV